ncbi:MAG: RNA polymerase subunit sigma-24 [Acidobacteria bacterium]|nr:MAG: RNA polymerase subunit sigma-24 [Acidobacteriota bacterium]
MEDFDPLLRLTVGSPIRAEGAMEPVALMSDRQIETGVIAACQRGDREAFQLLFETYKDRVYAIALYFFGGNEAQASDITQQVFLKLFTKIAQFRSEAEFTTWLYRLTTNACVDEQRKVRRLSQLDETFTFDQVCVSEAQEAQLARRETAERVKEAVAELKPKLRVAILLKYFEGLSYEEMAAALGCSKGTVASRLNRGHKALARRLQHLRGALRQGD